MLHTKPSTTALSSHSQRTPSDLKWLLNERAAAAGECERLRDDIAQLEARLNKLDAHRARLAQGLHRRQQRLSEASKLIAALDTSITLANPQCEPAAVGVVHAWAGRYGKRGALKAYVAERIQNAGPLGVSTTQLIDGAIAAFELRITLSPERKRFRKSVKSALTLLKADGLVTSTEYKTPNGSSIAYWSWKSLPSLDSLQQLSAAGRPPV